MSNLRQLLRSRFADALTQLDADLASYAHLVQPTQDDKFGDYQANFAMPLARVLKQNPREIAARVLDCAQLADVATRVEIAGAGFINITLADAWLAERAARLVGDDQLGMAPPAQPKTVVVDYSAPNIAKPMHVGHIRSTVIGDSICRCLRFAGHRAIGDNHIGDWGTQFGLLLVGYRRFANAEAYARNSVAELLRVYTQANDLQKTDPATADAARAELVKLHAGDAENQRLWAEFVAASRRELDGIYQRLNVSFDHALGESFYHDRLADVVAGLREAGIAEESQGAIVVFGKDRDEAPFIIQKSDGAYKYETTDLATIQHRMEEFQPDEILYVVDARQSQHFRMLFDVAWRWGYQTKFKHIAFGTIQGADGKPFRTREGGVIGLEPLLDEAVDRARRIVEDKNPGLSEKAKSQVAECVGLGAIKYADLSQNRTSDYVFSWDKMLAMQGNTAPYLQYAYARICSIFRKGQIDPHSLAAGNPTIQLTDPTERLLARELQRLPEVLDMVLEDYRPNLLCNYLFDLVGHFSSFYEACPVLKSDEPLRTSRLSLCLLTRRILKTGLHLLGIGVIDEM